MKIAIATDDFERVSGHAGQASRWLVYDHLPPQGLSSARAIELAREQVFHHWEEDAATPHPLDGVEVIVARSAGDGFLRRMQKRGVSVLLTSETLADAAILKVIAGDALPDPRWDASQLLCRLRDLFSRH
jgi:predicted Fe-Mo cluster-binding NifX family protein